VGAGIGLGPNALKAMEMMDPTFARMYDEIKVGNKSPERQHEQIEILGAEEGFGKLRGWEGGSVGHRKFERSSAHRKALLEVIKTLVPEGTFRIGKRVVDVRQVEKRVEMRFENGETVVVDALVGCDGIKGMTRWVVLEERYPEEVAAKYANTYVYRGIAPMEEARKIMGPYAEDARWWMMEGKGWAMYPISEGREANIAAFIMDRKPWIGEQASREVSREEMLEEFVGYDKRLQRLLEVSCGQDNGIPDTNHLAVGKACKVAIISSSSYTNIHQWSSCVVRRQCTCFKSEPSSRCWTRTGRRFGSIEVTWPR
jgi:salicylate hydroxylase